MRTVEEFQGWLAGYIEAGGKDVKRVQEEAAKIAPPISFPIPLPAQPIPLPTAPTYPRPFTDPWCQTGPNTCTVTGDALDWQSHN